MICSNSAMSHIWNNIKAGETVLVEYDSHGVPYLGVYHIIRWAKEKGYPVLVDDFLDTLYLYKTQMELADLDVSILENVDVIKIGGRLEVGNILGRIEVKEATVQERQYKEIAEPYFKEKGRVVINPVLGIEKIFTIAETKRETLATANTILSWVGHKERIAVYFINIDVLGKSKPYVLPLIEELATTVIRVVKEGKHYNLSILKSINKELDGIKIKL